MNIRVRLIRFKTLQKGRAIYIYECSELQNTFHNFPPLTYYPSNYVNSQHQIKLTMYVNAVGNMYLLM